MLYIWIASEAVHTQSFETHMFIEAVPDGVINPATPPISAPHQALTITITS